MGIAKIAIWLSFSWSVTQFFRNFQVTFIVVHGCFKISQIEVGIAKTTIRISFLYFISQFFRNFQTEMGSAKTAIRISFRLDYPLHLTK